jgi:hypothetical protein
MGKINKTYTLLLTLIIAVSSLAPLMIKPADAALENTPTPEFSIKYTDGSYDIPSTTTIDPFTGQPTTTPAQHINNQTITVTIKKQTTLYGDNQLYYQIQMKGYYSQKWANISHIEANPYSEYTIVTCAIDGNNASGQFEEHLSQVTSGGTVDFRVQAQILAASSNPYQMQMFWLDAISDWTPTLTITLIDGATSSSINTSPTPTQSPVPTPTVPELSWSAIVPMLLSLFSVALVVKHRKSPRLPL